MLSKDKTLFCVPSIFEANKIFKGVNFSDHNGFKISSYEGYNILITGVSKVISTFTLTKFLSAHKCSSLLLLGVAGAYQKSLLTVGEVVTVENDFFIDEANFDNYNITTLYEKKFIDIANNSAKFEVIKGIKKVNSNTVSLIQNSDILAELYRRKYMADIENMEGAAFGYVANMFEVSCLQLRAVSNFCGDTDKQAWDVNFATKNLAITVQELIKNNII